MGILDSIRGRFSSSPKLNRRSIYLDEKGRYKTVIATGKESAKGMSVAGRTESSLKAFKNYYENEGTIFAAIQTTAWNTVMVGYNLVSNDEDAKTLIQQKTP